MTDNMGPDNKDFWNNEPVEDVDDVEEDKSEALGFFEKKKNKTIIAIAGVALALISAVGIGSRIVASNNRQQTTNEATTTPTVEKVPPEAELFAEQYSERYSDPISTWYAREALKAETGKNYVLTPSAITTYEKIDSEGRRVGPIGFETYTLPASVVIDKTSSIEIFNTYTCIELSRYLNYLAKNPTPEGEILIDHQFLTNCSNAYDINSPSEFKEDDRGIDTLIETAHELVEKYGSTANYTVQPGSLGNTDPNRTTFIDNGIQYSLDDNGKPIGSIVDADVVILVDIYKNNIVMHTKEILKSASMSMLRQPPYTDELGTPVYENHMSIGQYKKQ